MFGARSPAPHAAELRKLGAVAVEEHIGPEAPDIELRAG
jgi:hypothetical protein